MAENTKIEWCDHTFNCWRGCTKVSAGCANCYADTMSRRNPGVLGVWGPNGTRVVASEAKWAEPLKWDREAKASQDFMPGQERPRVFCASLADVFEDWRGPMVRGMAKEHLEHELCICHECSKWMQFTSLECDCQHDRLPRKATMDDVRARLFNLIDATPNLDWLLLTKRPENVLPMLDGISNGQGDAWNLRDHMPNVWLGTSVEDQAAADARIPHLLKVPAAVRFLSVEPLLGPIRFRDVPGFNLAGSAGQDLIRNFWVIVGGESGPGARACDAAWIRSIVSQCRHAGVSCFVKQLGAKSIETETEGGPEWPVCLQYGSSGYIEPALRDRKGGDIEEWPADLQVREFPTPR